MAGTGVAQCGATPVVIGASGVEATGKAVLVVSPLNASANRSPVSVCVIASLQRITATPAGGFQARAPLRLEVRACPWLCGSPRIRGSLLLSAAIPRRSTPSIVNRRRSSGSCGAPDSPGTSRIPKPLCSRSCSSPRRARPFLDVGAHIGLYQAMVSAIFGTRGHRAVAFEPAPQTAHICRSLRDANGLDFDVVECAVGHAVRGVRCTCRRVPNSCRYKSLEPTVGTVHVPVTTVDRFTSVHRVDPWLMKIDVETYEPQVLAGAFETIERCRPWIAVARSSTRPTTSR